jgi:hypothetical protein
MYTVILGKYANNPASGTSMLDSVQDLNSRLHVLTNKQTNKNTTTFTTDQKCTLTFFSYLNTSYQDSWQNLGTFLEKKEFAKMSAIQVVLLVFCLKYALE